MRTPDELTFGQRFVLTLAIVLAIIFALALTGWLSGRWSEAQGQQAKQLYADIPLDAHLLQADKRALDDAYHAQLLLLFSTWLRDGAGDPTRISNGLRIARRAYNTAAQEIARREEEIQRKP